MGSILFLIFNFCTSIPNINPSQVCMLTPDRFFFRGAPHVSLALWWRCFDSTSCGNDSRVQAIRILCTHIVHGISGTNICDVK